MDKELPLIIGDSSAIDFIFAYIQRKRIIFPSFVDISGLHIIMAIEHHRRQ